MCVCVCVCVRPIMLLVHVFSLTRGNSLLYLRRCWDGLTMVVQDKHSYYRGSMNQGIALTWERERERERENNMNTCTCINREREGCTNE